MSTAQEQSVSGATTPSATRLCGLALLFAICALGAAFSMVSVHPPAPPRQQAPAIPQYSTPPSGRSVPADTHASEAVDRTEFSGDGGVSSAAVVKQVPLPSTRYTIHVRAASGAEQFISVTAPPGGLELEVRDMTGDNVRNDLVLRPALLHWPLTVLLNDGHDHYTLAISGRYPSSAQSGGDQASESVRLEEPAVLIPSSAVGTLANQRRLVAPKTQRSLLCTAAQTLASCTEGGPSAGRAPPSVASWIS